jgi:hypothetical protein
VLQRSPAVAGEPPPVLAFERPCGPASALVPGICQHARTVPVQGAIHWRPLKTGGARATAANARAKRPRWRSAHKAKLRSRVTGRNGQIRRCRVTHRDAAGTTHRVEVHASGLHQAACYALGEFRSREGERGEPPGQATELTVEVIPPPVPHIVRVADVMRWPEGVAVDPATVLRKARLKRMLGPYGVVAKVSQPARQVGSRFECAVVRSLPLCNHRPQ